MELSAPYRSQTKRFILHYKEDTVNVVRGLTAPVLFFFPFYMDFPEGYSLLVALLLWAMLSDINHVIHLHVHNPFTKSRCVNLLLDLSMGFVTGMTASNWRIQHILGHHRGRAAEYGLGYKWEMEEFSVLGAISYSTRTIWPIFFEPIVESYRRAVDGTKHASLDYRWALLEQILFLGMVLILAITFPRLMLAYVCPWYLLVYFVTRYTDYLNHFGCTSGDERITNNCTSKLYNALRNNFGYHTAHHMFPTAHWTQLPKLHAAVATQIPKKHLKDYNWSGFLMPYHFYLSMRNRM